MPYDFCRSESYCLLYMFTWFLCCYFFNPLAPNTITSVSFFLYSRFYFVYSWVFLFNSQVILQLFHHLILFFNWLHIWLLCMPLCHQNNEIVVSSYYDLYSCITGQMINVYMVRRRLKKSCLKDVLWVRCLLSRLPCLIRLQVIVLVRCCS